MNVSTCDLARQLKVWGLSGELQEAACFLGGPTDEASATAARLAAEVIPLLQVRSGSERLGNPQVLRRGRVYAAAYQQPGLAVLAAAEAFHRMGQASAPPARLIEEVDDFLIPLLEMLGMGQPAQEARAWSFAHGNRKRTLQRLQAIIDHELPRLQQVHTAIEADLHTILQDCALVADVRWLQPTPLQWYHPDFAENHRPDVLYGLSYLILLPQAVDCYRALYELHRCWDHLDGSLEDTIGGGKINGYRSLQTAVHRTVHGNRYRLHFRLLTTEMHGINSWGVAASELRSDDRPKLPPPPGAWWADRTTGARQIQSAGANGPGDRFYVFSPQGELFAMPQGCSVVDFAYKVHSDLANQCKRFRVNGVEVEPTYTLRHLDIVELHRDPLAQGPSLVWLNSARTAKARHSIRRFLRNQAKGYEHGRRLFETRQQELEEHYGFSLPESRLAQALSAATRWFGVDSTEALYSEIAAGRVMPDQILNRLFASELTRQIQLPPDLRLRPGQLKIAQCCRPHVGATIIGRPRWRNRAIVGLKIHTRDCPRIPAPRSPEEQPIPLRWRLRPPASTLLRLEVTALDEPGLLGACLGVIYQSQAEMVLHRVDAMARHGRARMRFTIEADPETFDEIEEKLLALHGYSIESMRRMQLLLSEWEDLAVPLTRRSTNPYSRLPVDDPDMFFGRQDEVRRVLRLLDSGASLISLRGQKRIGKTSLLLHLRNVGLSQPDYVPIFIDFQYFPITSLTDIYFEIASAVYSGLQADGRISEMGAPYRDLFQTNGPAQLELYLRNVQAQLGKRLVLLMDEFSTTMDAYRLGHLPDGFFSQWRALLQQTARIASYVIVVQQKSFEQLHEIHRDDPAWQFLEYSQPLVLRPLGPEEIPSLIERPVRNYFRFAPDALQTICRLTGGSPFLIQAFCFSLVNHLADSGSETVTARDVEAVRQEFLAPEENLFSHLLDLAPGADERVLSQAARIASPGDGTFSLSALRAALADWSDPRLNQALSRLVGNDLLDMDESGGQVRFSSLLFAQWLAQNAMTAEPYAPGMHHGE